MHSVEGMWDGPQLDRLAAVSLAAQRIGYFVDVGADSGFYSVMFAKRNLAEHIIAFEPDPGNYARLMSNLTLNGLVRRVDTRCLALGDNKRKVMLFEGAKWNRGESSIAVPDQTPKEVTHMVLQERLDDVFVLSRQKIIIKMDVEGHEFKALAGMQQALRQTRAMFRLSFSDRYDELQQFFTWTWSSFCPYGSHRSFLY